LIEYTSKNFTLSFTEDVLTEQIFSSSIITYNDN